MVVAVVTGTAGGGDRVDVVGELSVLLGVVRQIALHHGHGEIVQEIVARVAQVEALLLFDLPLKFIVQSLLPRLQVLVPLLILFLVLLLELLDWRGKRRSLITNLALN